MAQDQDDAPVYVSAPGYTSSYCQGRVSEMCGVVDNMVYNIGKYISMDFENAMVYNEMKTKATVMILKCDALKSRLSGVYFE